MSNIYTHSFKEKTIPKSSTHRILHNQLQLRPYKLQLLQDLKEEDYEQHVKFDEWLGSNSHFLTKVFWSNEAYIHLNGDFSRYHCRILSESNPHRFITKPLVWFGFTADVCVEPFFLMKMCYLEMLQHQLRPQLVHKRKLSSVMFM